MIAFLPPLLALAMGWPLAIFLGKRCGFALRLEHAVALGMLALFAWLVLLDVLGVRWTTVAILLPAIVAVIAGGWLTCRKVPRSAPHIGLWGAVAVGGAGIHAVVLAMTPCFGWDFRFVWGLKARVAALAGGHDLSWLSWPANNFARPDYPPLWSDLLASGVVLGAPVGQVAAGWQALIVLALASCCWHCADRSPGFIRCLAAGVGVFVPFILQRTVSYSGYAEPLLAFFSALSFTSLSTLNDNEGRSWPIVATFAAGLSLVKNEGLVLALCVALVAGFFIGRRCTRIVLAVLLSGGIWRLLVAVAGLSGWGLVFAPNWILDRLGHLPAALVSTMTTEMTVLCVVLVLIVVILWFEKSNRPAVIAFGIYLMVVIAAYLASPLALTWHLVTSLDRVLAASAAGLACLALRVSWMPQRNTAV